MFWSNAQKRLTALAVQIAHTNKPGISNTAKSSYYRAATLQLCTIIEGTVYQIVKKHAAPNNIVDRAREYKPKLKISKNTLNTTNDLYICELVETDVHIDNQRIVNFAKLNLYLKNKGIITKNEYNKLERIRKERNKLHLQSLTTIDIGYTRDKFLNISNCLRFLFPKLKDD